MKTMQLLAVGAIVCLVASFAAADEKKTDYAKMVVGKWEVTKSFDEGPPVGAQAELTKDGKLHVKFKMGDEEVKIEGTYKVDVAVHKRDGYPYDYHRLLYTFRVKSRTHDVGIYRPHHHWNFSAGIRFKPDMPDKR